MALTDRYPDDIGTKNEQMIKYSSEGQNLPNEDSGQKSDENTYDGVIDLSETRRKCFHVNRGSGAGGDLYLNTSDMNIITRLEELYPKLQKLSQDASIKQLDIKDATNEKYVSKISQALKRIDTQMRDIIDEIFDSNVSEICAPDGSMFDPFNGDFRFEHIISKISALYDANVNDEFKKMSDKMKKRTSKYTKGK